MCKAEILHTNGASSPADFPMNDLKTKFAALKEKGERIAALTAYDYPMARLLDESGVDILLIGDSLGMVVQGQPDTTSVTLRDIEYHTGMVARAARHAVVIADLPFRTFETPEKALESAQVLLGAGAVGVKLEGGLVCEDHIKALTGADIPVMGHIGMLPQKAVEEGGYRIKGKTPAGRERLIADARAVEAAGAFAVVLELVHAPLAKEISELLTIPTIGIGSGEGCNGEILVTHDLIGLFPWFTPKFVKRRASIAEHIREATKDFVADTKLSYAERAC